MIDSHCHINDEMYIDNPKQYVEDSLNAGVNTLLVVGCNLKNSIDAVNIAHSFDCCYAAIGIHPSDSKFAKENDLKEIDKLANENKVLAIGEIGLDYYWDKDDEIKEIQKKYFIEQIKIANKHNLPISIHCRDAYEDCLNILKQHQVNNGGVMHCYGGSKEMMNEFIKLGFMIGLGGTTTFKNAVRPKEVASIIDSNNYLLETDAPYLAPSPYRGKPNHSKYLYLIRDQIASLRNVSPLQVEEETTNNFKKLFKL